MNKQSTRLLILRRQHQAEVNAKDQERAEYKFRARNHITITAPPPLCEDLPLPPTYYDDLEHWLKTLAPAKPAAPALAAGCAHEWVRGIDLPLAERFGMWHYRADQWHKPGNVSDAIEIDDEGEYRRAAPGAKLGDRYDESKYATADTAARLASTSSADGEGLMHKVCIRAHIGKYGGAWKIGEVVHITYKVGDESAWLPSDKDGWIPHNYAKHAVCPVPDGIQCAIKHIDGSVCGVETNNTARTGNDWFGWDSVIVAWRPIADGRK